MRRHFASGFPRALLSLSQEKSSGVEIVLRTVPTIVIAHTLCESHILGFLSVVLINAGIFLRDLKLCRESRSS